MAKKKSKKLKSDTDSDISKPEKKSGGVISQLILAFTLGATSFGTVFMLPESSSTPHQDVAKAEHSKKAEVVGLPKLDTTFVPLNGMTISLHENQKILKIGITLETVDDGGNVIDPDDPKLRDAYMGYLRSLRVEQIEDAAFMAQMRSQLLRRAQLILGSETVQGVLITDFLVR